MTIHDFEVRVPSIKQRWELYSREAIPPDAPAVLREECMRAFYAGAFALFTGVMSGLSAGKDTTAEDLMIINGFYQELEEWVERMTSEPPVRS